MTERIIAEVGIERVEIMAPHHGAEVVLVERPAGEAWDVHLLTRAVDTGSGRTIGRGHVIATIRQVGNAVEWMTRGANHPGGNRYFVADNISEAQERVIAWAARRFRAER